MLNTAIILAGGFGTRLQSVVTDVPKPMAPINNLPFLNYQFNYLKHFGIQKVILSVGYLSEKITEFYKNNFNGMDIDYSIEDDPMGTGGGIRLAMEKCKSKSVLVLNGDSFFDINLNSFFHQHHTYKSDCSLSLRRVENAARYGTIKLGNYGVISSFKEKDGQEKQGLINAGVYMLNKSLFLDKTPANQNFSIEKDFFEKKINESTIYGFEFDGYFIDIGIPEDYLKAQHDFKDFKY